jgi:hypothetical protein
VGVEGFSRYFGSKWRVTRTHEGSEAGADATPLSAAECVLGLLEPSIDIVRQVIVIQCK